MQNISREKTVFPSFKSPIFVDHQINSFVWAIELICNQAATCSRKNVYAQVLLTKLRILCNTLTAEKWKLSVFFFRFPIFSSLIEKTFLCDCFFDLQYKKKSKKRQFCFNCLFTFFKKYSRPFAPNLKGSFLATVSASVFVYRRIFLPHFLLSKSFLFVTLNQVYFLV